MIIIELLSHQLRQCAHCTHTHCSTTQWQQIDIIWSEVALTSTTRMSLRWMHMNSLSICFATLCRVCSCLIQLSDHRMALFAFKQMVFHINYRTTKSKDFSFEKSSCLPVSQCIQYYNCTYTNRQAGMFHGFFGLFFQNTLQNQMLSNAWNLFTKGTHKRKRKTKMEKTTHTCRTNICYCFTFHVVCWWTNGIEIIKNNTINSCIRWKIRRNGRGK